MGGLSRASGVAHLRSAVLAVRARPGEGRSSLTRGTGTPHGNSSRPRCDTAWVFRGTRVPPLSRFRIVPCGPLDEQPKHRRREKTTTTVGSRACSSPASVTTTVRHVGALQGACSSSFRAQLIQAPAAQVSSAAGQRACNGADVQSRGRGRSPEICAGVQHLIDVSDDLIVG